MANSWSIPLDGLDLRATLARIEGGYIRAALARTRTRGRTSRSRAAKLLGLKYRAYCARLAKHATPKDTK